MNLWCVDRVEFSWYRGTEVHVRTLNSNYNTPYRTISGILNNAPAQTNVISTCTRTITLVSSTSARAAGARGATRASQHARSLDPERRREADGLNTRTMSDRPLHLSIEALPAAAQGMAPLRRRLAVPRECGYISSSVPCDDDNGSGDYSTQILSWPLMDYVWTNCTIMSDAECSD